MLYPKSRLAFWLLVARFLATFGPSSTVVLTRNYKKGRCPLAQWAEVKPLPAVKSEIVCGLICHNSLASGRKPCLAHKFKRYCITQNTQQMILCMYVKGRPCGIAHGKGQPTGPREEVPKWTYSPNPQAKLACGKPATAY